MSKIIVTDSLTWSGTGYFSGTHMVTLGIKG